LDVVQELAADAAAAAAKHAAYTLDETQ